MPIRTENRDRYPKEWDAITARIRARAGDKCERCGAPNGELICRGDDDTYMVKNGDVFDADTGEHLGRARGSEYPGRYVVVVLTVAHLDHTPEHCDDDNLKAWCQRCHNRYDAPVRAAGGKARARAGLAGADLFA